MVIAGGVSMTARRKPCWRRTSRSEARRATVVWAKAGMSASRSFHQSARLPCGSMSIRQTGPAPDICACTARCPDKVVLPDPPFCDAKAKTRMYFPSPNDVVHVGSGTTASKIWLTLLRPCLRISRSALHGSRVGIDMILKYLVAAAFLAASTSSVSAQTVHDGILAWQHADYDAAVRIWRPLAERGDADAAFNLGQAYRLGRGVQLNLSAAATWFGRAAAKGHVDAQTTLGLMLFENGDRAG